MIISTRGTDVLKTIPQAAARRDPLNRLVAFLYKRAFRKADWVTVTSKSQLDSVFRVSSRNNHLSIVRTGVDTRGLRADTTRYFPLGDHRPFILFPRYIKPIYYHEFCLEAISLLPLPVKERYKMVFVGRDSGDGAYQKKLVALMSRQSDVAFEFIGQQEQKSIYELYKRASAIVMTPLSDGSPVSGMEALLCGAKLILGPLNYDEDVFSAAIKLTEWNPAELADKMGIALEHNTNESGISARMSLEMDRKYNMEKVREIYNRLLA